MTGQISPPLIAIVGATATGKTALSVALAKRFNGEVINADSMQFYRGMDIGTAKATVPERAGVPHHLLDVFELEHESTVAEFQHQARAHIKDIQDRGKVPILVGGSGLYVRAVLDEIEFPPTDPGVRQKWENFVNTQGLQKALNLLRVVDPTSAERLNDQRRIVRALEVHELTGHAFSSYMPERQYSFDGTYQIGLRIDREVLYTRIAQRVETMILGGLVDETQALLSRGLKESPTASRAIGYPQTIQFLDGEITRDEWQEKIVVATRQFARRQETWFKADPRVHWFDHDDHGSIMDFVEQKIQESSI